MAQVSEDGFWQFENGQWVPTQMQLEALSNGAKPYVEEIVTPIQNQPIQETQVMNGYPNQITNYQSNQTPNNQFSNNFQNNIAHVQNNQIPNNQYSQNNVNYEHKNRNSGFVFSTKLKVASGSVILALIVALIILFAALSPGTSGLVDELKDSDGDGISDDDEIEMGTDPKLRDSDNDDLDDDVDDCPVGDTGWKSTIVTDFDQDGCKDSTEDLDDDNDGINDLDDNCDTSELGWKSTPEDDNDSDGCHDDGDADDDNDGWSDTKEQQCGTNSLSRFSIPADFDGDMICDIVDSDDDNDGVIDSQDLFPMDSSEWADFDDDGIGDNADTDDDNDGVVDSLDMNDYADVGILLTYDTFKVITAMDYWDNQAEVYICSYVEGSNVGCGPDQSGYYWSLTTSTTYSIETEIFVDLPETNEYHSISICAWDSDAFDDDRIDISPSSSNNCYNFNFYTTYIHSGTITASGEGDGQGWDGEMVFSYEVTDLRNQRIQNFEWSYDGSTYSMNLNLDYSIYSEFKAKDHTVGGIYDPDSYAVFATPNEQYVIEIAQDLKTMANNAGYYSDYDIAMFVYAFVGDIQYELDIDGVGTSDYPKYPIEMLWTATGDCEDAAILYISLVEALDYDAILATGLVKSSSNEDWSGHAWAIVNVDGASGTYWTFTTKGADRFYFVEATGYYEGSSYIGRNPWSDLDEVHFADVE